MTNDRWKKQLEFIVEVDKLKQVYRQTFLADGSRMENDAEHSWHLAIMAVLLSEYADKNINLAHVVEMLIIHDLVEIEAGDTYVYDPKDSRDKLEREQKAAERLFSILPSDQREKIYDLWKEFEERQTPEARFAAALDRLQPLLLNYTTRGKSWISHGITSERVLKVNRAIKEGSTVLWGFACKIIRDAVEKGYLPL